MRPAAFLTLSSLIAASAGLAQSVSISMSGSPDGRTFVITVTPRPEIPAITAMTGAPYCGRQVSSSVQTLVDGTRLTRSSPLETLTCRDSAGRFRRERPAFPSSLPGVKPPVSFTIIEITDPVGGYSYLLDSVNRIAYRFPLKAGPMPQRPPTPVRPPAATLVSSTQIFSDGRAVQSEQLAPRMISGVLAEGIRTTMTHPAGSFMGNDRPVTTVSETWTHPQTGVALVTKSTGPNGDNSMSMEDYSTLEPDPMLFQAPPDYRIVDETGPFKIVLPMQN